MASGGRELRAHSEPVRWSAQHRHLGHRKRDKLSGQHKQKTSGQCVCVCVFTSVCVCAGLLKVNKQTCSTVYLKPCDSWKRNSICSWALIICWPWSVELKRCRRQNGNQTGKRKGNRKEKCFLLLPSFLLSSQLSHDLFYSPAATLRNATPKLRTITT